MQIQLSDKFNYRRLLRFVAPCIAMIVFTSIYCVVDGLFVSNFAGKTPFAALNLIWPFIMILGSLGFMIGTGGSAIVSKTLGEGRNDDANKYFSFLIFFTCAISVVIAVGCVFAVPSVSKLLGAEGELLSYSVEYGRILVIGVPTFILQNVFQSFCTTAEKPKFGFWVTVAAGMTNIVFDAIFVAGCRMGLKGAAIATVMSQAVGAVVPLIFFIKPRGGLLKFTRCEFYGKVLLKTLTNGSSEFVANISGSIVSMLFNYQLMRLTGENGVAAYGVLMNVNFIYVAIFIGYSIGVAPIIGFNYGAQNTDELKNVVKKSIVIMWIIGAAMVALAEALAVPLSKLFVGYDAELYEMTRNAFFVYSFEFVFVGINIFGSSMFTALNNGAVSAAISFVRTIIFQVASVIVLPMLLGLNGIWMSGIVANACATIVTAICFFALRKRYGYI